MANQGYAQRANILLNLPPSYEVYKVSAGYEIGDNWGRDYICFVCRETTQKDDAVRDVWTRRAGTQWAERMHHVVHVTCFRGNRAC